MGVESKRVDIEENVIPLCKWCPLVLQVRTLIHGEKKAGIGGVQCILRILAE